MPGTYPQTFILSRDIILARDLSVFVDEGGDRSGKARYYLLTLAIHDQADSISDKVARYEESLLRSDLPNLERRKTSMTNYRLERAADCLCTIEPAAIKYAAKEDGETYNKFFGGIGPFKKNWLKQARRKAI